MIKLKLFIGLCSIICTVVVAAIDYFPHSFEWGEKIVFMDIKNIHYQLYPKKSGELKVVSTIEFYQKERGHPAFVLLHRPSSIHINGKKTSLFRRSNINPSNGYYERRDPTKLRAINKELSAGKHTLKIVHKIRNMAKYSNNAWKIRFELFDIKKNNQLLGKYLPTNLEFDHYKADLSLYIKRKSNQAVLSNGVEKWHKDHLRISYPKHITSSSLFLYLDNKSNQRKHYYTSHYWSIDGRKIPMTFWFGKSGGGIQKIKKLKSYLKLLESKLGAWPHAKLTMVDSSSLLGGMEYAGAFYGKETSWFHEMLHSYFGRGIFPANGKALWIDEALVNYLSERWKMAKSGRIRSRSFLNKYKYKGVLTSYSLHTSETPMESYSVGPTVINEIVKKCFGTEKKFISFLKWWMKKRMFSSIDTRSFESDMRKYLEVNYSKRASYRLEKIFNDFVD